MIRTCDPLIRSQVLYPAELRVLKNELLDYKLCRHLSSHSASSEVLTHVVPTSYGRPENRDRVILVFSRLRSRNSEPDTIEFLFADIEKRRVMGCTRCPNKREPAADRVLSGKVEKIVAGHYFGDAALPFPS